MKSSLCLFLLGDILSRPARGAWVEIEEVEELRVELQGRAPQGARGLKS